LWWCGGYCSPGAQVGSIGPPSVSLLRVPQVACVRDLPESRRKPCPASSGRRRWRSLCHLPPCRHGQSLCLSGVGWGESPTRVLLPMLLASAEVNILTKGFVEAMLQPISHCPRRCCSFLCCACMCFMLIVARVYPLAVVWLSLCSDECFAIIDARANALPPMSLRAPPCA
jgi:hypothetical protein